MEINYIINKKIKKITVELPKVSCYWIYVEYQPAVTGFFGYVKCKEIKDGYYNRWNSDMYYETADEVIKIHGGSNLYVNTSEPKESRIWEKACVKIKFKRDSQIAYFDTDKEAMEFAENISKEYKHIKIIK